MMFFLLLIVGYICYITILFNQNIPILAYHDVLENPVEETDVSIEAFEKQMKYLYKHHYKTLSLEEYYKWKKGEKIPGKKVVLTFDDGKESFYTTIVPILEKYHFKAVNFVIQNAIDVDGYMTSKQIEDLKQNYHNIEIQSHSYYLHDEKLAKSNNFDIYNEDIKLYQDKNYKYYAYPFGITYENYQNALKENGYKLAFLYSPSKWSNKKQDDYLVTRVPIYKSNSLFKFKLKVLLKI